MASLAIASVQHTSHQAQQQIDEDLPHASEKSSLPAKDYQNPSGNIDHDSKPVTPQDPDPVTATPDPDPEWKAGKEEWMIILVIAIVSLMVALDATILVPVLPVGDFKIGVTKSSREI